MGGGWGCSFWLAICFVSRSGWLVLLPALWPATARRTATAHPPPETSRLSHQQQSMLGCKGQVFHPSLVFQAHLGRSLQVLFEKLLINTKKKKKAVTHVVTPRAEKSHTPAGFLAGERHERALVDFGCSSCWSLCTGILSSPPPRPPAG